MKTNCLNCRRLASGEGFYDVGEFCSRECAQAHRDKLLGRLAELEEAPGSDLSRSSTSSLLALAQMTSSLQNSTTDLSGQSGGPNTDSFLAESTGRLVTFLPAQGGSGASTAALHVADAVARDRNERVLLIDYDFHSSTTAFRLGLQPKGTLDDLLVRTSMSQARLAGAVSRWGALDVLVPSAQRSPQALMFSRLDEVMELALQDYSFVVVDHPDALYSASQSALSRSSFVGLVCTPDISALYLVRRKRKLITDLTARYSTALGLIVNRSESWGSLTSSDVERVAEAKIVGSLSNDYAALRRAAWGGGLVDEESTLAGEFSRLAEKVRELAGGSPGLPLTEQVEESLLKA